MITGELAEYMTYVFVLLNGSTGLFILVHSVLLNQTLRAEVAHRARRACGGEDSESRFRDGKGEGESYVCTCTVHIEDDALFRRRLILPPPLIVYCMYRFVSSSLVRGSIWNSPKNHIRPLDSMIAFRAHLIP